MLLTYLKYALLALAVTLVSVPSAAATLSVCANDDWEASVCARGGSSTYGSCDDANGMEETTVGASQYSQALGYAGAGVQTSCSSYSYGWEEYHWTSQEQRFLVGGEASGQSAYLVWSSYEGESNWGSYSGCETRVSVLGFWTQGGCPFGAPPQLPMVLP